MEKLDVRSAKYQRLTEIFKLIDQLFPFHIIFDRELQFIQVGKNILKIDNGCQEGSFVRNHFHIKKPKVDFNYETLFSKKDRTFVFSFLNNDVNLRGELVMFSKEEIIVFVGNPILSNGDLFIKNNISINDFAAYDTFPDFLFSIQAQENSYKEIQELVKKLQRSKEKLMQSNAELEQFAYIASHDLQSPLRTIVSFAQLLEKKYKDRIDRIGKEYLDFIITGTIRMQNLINDLLEYSKVHKEGNHFELVDFQAVVESIKWDMRYDIEKENATITCSQIPEIYSNPVLINHLLQNLLSNAIKFRQIDDPVIHVQFEEKQNDWLFSVTDNGIGFDMEDGKRIFEIFQRAVGYEKYSGTGIGLAICKKVVELHKGKIWVHSEPLKGTTFYFTISKYLSTSF